jgi:hypothetical protein
MIFSRCSGCEDELGTISKASALVPRRSALSVPGYAIPRKYPVPRDVLSDLYRHGPLREAGADICGAKVTLLHVIDPGGYTGFELYVRPLSDVATDHEAAARVNLGQFLQNEFPEELHRRIVLSGDPGSQIA